MIARRGAGPLHQLVGTWLAWLTVAVLLTNGLAPTVAAGSETLIGVRGEHRYSYDTQGATTTPSPNTRTAARGDRTAAETLRSPTSSIALRRAAKGAGSAVDDVGAAIVPRTPISGHAATRFAERGITSKQVEVALQRGTRYYDRRNQTYSYVLDQGYASGKSLVVGTNPLTGNVATAIRQSRRFNPDAAFDGASRYLPAPR